MLIDYPSIKQRIEELINERMRRALLHPLFDSGGMRLANEGNRFSVAGDHGWKHEGEFKEAEALLEVNLEEYESLTFNDLLERVDRATAELLAKKSKMMFESLDKITRETGNVIDARGAATPEHLFAMIEKVDMSFDSKGQPQMALVAGTEACKKLVEVIQKIETDPVLKQRMDLLMQRKKDDWSDRESSRALVG